MIYHEKIKIESGNIVFPRKKIAESISKMKDGFYWMNIEKFYKQRSGQQNRAKFGIAYKILRSLFSESFGYQVSTEWVHEFCKERFLPGDYVDQLKVEWEQNKVLVNYETGQEIEIPFRLTTTKMSTVQEMEYYKNMQLFCAEFFNTEIPDPDPNYRTKIHEQDD
jgi:hypothetical protein